MADTEQGVCELRHSSSLVLPASPSLTWFLREEHLEIQLWLGQKTYHSKEDWHLPRQKDRLVGSAFVDMSSLVLSHRKRLGQIRYCVERACYSIQSDMLSSYWEIWK